MDPTSDWKELLALLNARGVNYVIVGGHAMAHHGAPRLTGDLDILIWRSPENAKRVLHALAEFGFGSLQISENDLTDDDTIIQLGFSPGRVDILTSISGVSNEEVFAEKVAGEFKGVPVYYVGKSQFISNKKAVGRLRDLADINAVEGKN